MKTVKFGKFLLGDGQPVVVIAEIADSHNGSVATAKKMIDEAKQAGANIVKFQFHLPDVEMVPDSIQRSDGSLYDILKKNLFTFERHKEVKDYCDKKGVMYLCTPFSMAASDQLEKLGVAAYKIGSGEMNNLPMIEHLAKKGKTIMVSLGMCTLEEIGETVGLIKKIGTPFVLAHCVSEYPTKPEHLNLKLIPKYKEEFKVPVGFSDHSLDNYGSFAAVALGANFIERHFTLDRKQQGPDHAISLEPPHLKDLVRGIRTIEQGLGENKKISLEEQKVRDWAYHSVVTNQALTAGTILTKEMLTVKRPGTGIPAKEINKVAGKRLKKDVKLNTVLQWEDLA